MAIEKFGSKKSNQRTVEVTPLFNHVDFKKSHMTVKEAMNCFDVCRTTIYNWERSKILLAQRIGRRVYYTYNPNQQVQNKFGFPNG